MAREKEVSDDVATIFWAVTKETIRKYLHCKSDSSEDEEGKGELLSTGGLGSTSHNTGSSRDDDFTGLIVGS